MALDPMGMGITNMVLEIPKDSLDFSPAVIIEFRSNIGAIQQSKAIPVQLSSNVQKYLDNLKAEVEYYKQVADNAEEKARGLAEIIKGDWRTAFNQDVRAIIPAILSLYERQGMGEDDMKRIVALAVAGAREIQAQRELLGMDKEVP